jgi:phosphoribosylformylglycinamidine cyclo-ligase
MTKDSPKDQEKRGTYKDSGVDIEAAALAVMKIKDTVRATHDSRVINAYGSFASLVRLGEMDGKVKVLVESTDGVGTKLMVAYLMNRYDTVGIDLVAMNVNDVLVTGAVPLTFQDYIGAHRLDPFIVSELIKGVAEGCILAGCSLTGGEMAEMPGFYKEGLHNLSGHATGLIDLEDVIDGRNIGEGDRLIGLRSSGLHSNGYSLVRKIIFEDLSLKVDSPLEGASGISVGEELLKPTRIYVKSVLRVLGEHRGKVLGMAHITGGGLLENLPRVLPPGLMAYLDTSSWKRPYIFDFLMEKGSVELMEMYRVFNMGIGYVLIVESSAEEGVIKTLEDAGEEPVRIGVVEPRPTDSPGAALRLGGGRLGRVGL